MLCMNVVTAVYHKYSKKTEKKKAYGPDADSHHARRGTTLLSLQSKGTYELLHVDVLMVMM